MKHSFTILIILLLNLTEHIDLYAQQKPYNIDWSRCYGGSREDNGGVGSRQRPILSTPDGGVIFAAITNSKDGDIDKNRRHNDMFQQDSFINDDIWIVKLARDNTIEWEQYFGGEGTDFVTDMKVTSDGGYIICGSTSSFKGDFPMDTTGIFDILAHGGFPDCFLIKLDSVGRKQWVTRVGGSNSDYLSSVIQATDGGYLAVGQSYSTDESWLGFSWIRNPGPWPDALVIKIGSDGSKHWSKLYGGTKMDGFLSVVEQSFGTFILSGATESDDGDVSKLHYKDSVNSIGLIYDVWIVEISNTGTIIRDKCFGGSDSEGGDQILSTTDGGYIINGTTSPGNPPARFRTGDVIGYHPEKKV